MPYKTLLGHLATILSMYLPNDKRYAGHLATLSTILDVSFLKLQIDL